MGTRYMSFGLPEPWGSIVRELAAKRQITPAQFIVHCVQAVAPETRVQHAADRPFAGSVSAANTIECTFLGTEARSLTTEMAKGLVQAFNHVIAKGGVHSQVYARPDGEPSTIRVSRRGGGLSLTFDKVKLTMSVSKAQQIAHDLGSICESISDTETGVDLVTEASHNNDGSEDSLTQKNPNFGIFA